ncbi:MAG TPA: DNA polymerase IV, partial [Acidimicrobiales bacterium]|nr:DNA polymerase IV [Acidimicrobiales bacterium]
MHVDLDAFFAAVEVLDDPSLAGRPVIVGGTGNRGVVAACTYEARAFGIHSAMSSVEARRRCPHAVFLPGRFDRYSEISTRFHEVLQRFTPMVEGIALDEAFLDVSGARRILGPPPTIARAIRQAVTDELHLHCAVGVARTKLLAKLASRAAKPTAARTGTRPGLGVVVIEPHRELAFLHPLPVRALWGVGPATGNRLADLGVVTVGDLAAIPVETLCRVVGTAHGRALAALARGDDTRSVVALQEVKSVGHEETFAADLHGHDETHRHVVRMSDAVGRRLQEALVRGRTITVKVRFGDFSTITRSHTVAHATDSPRAIGAVAGALLEGVDVSPGVRLLGVSMSGLVSGAAEPQQLSFSDAPSGGPGDAGTFEQDGPARPPGGPAGVAAAGGGSSEARSPEGAGDRGWEEVEAAVMAIRTRYGHGSVGPGTLIGGSGLGVK